MLLHPPFGCFWSRTALVALLGVACRGPEFQTATGGHDASGGHGGAGAANTSGGGGVGGAGASGGEGAAGGAGGTGGAVGTPTVTATSPDDRETGAEPDGTITATFSLDMDEATLDASTFVVTDESGTVTIEGEVTYDGPSRTATFTPAKRLELLGRNNATITSGATSSGGTALASDYDWSFEIRDGVWNTDELLDNAAGAVSFPQVAADQDDDAIAVWTQDIAGTFHVRANRWVSGAGWQGAIPLESSNGAGSTSVAFDPLGNAAVVWNQSNGASDFDVWGARYQAGSGWQTPVPIHVDLARPSTFPFVVLDAAGNGFVSWQEGFGGQYDAGGSRYAGGTWGAATTLDNQTQSTSLPRISVDSAGNAFAAWLATDDITSEIWTARYTIGGGWAPPSKLEDGTTEPVLAFDADGNAIALYGFSNDVHAARYDATSGWSAGVAIDDDVGTVVVFSTSVGFDASGNAIAVWAQGDGTRDNIWANRYVAGSGWGAAELIEASDTGSAAHPRVVVDPSGNAIAAWDEDDGPPYHVWANRYIAGVGWGAAQPLENHAGDAVLPALALGVGGTAFAVWQQANGAAFSDVRAAAFR